jgi:uncharacterized membrane protein
LSEKVAESHGLSEKTFEVAIGTLLRVGVTVAAAVVLGGGIFYLTKYADVKPDYRIFRGERTDLRSIAGVLHDAATLHSRGIIQLGLLLLIATPIARVAFSVAGFALQRDWLYVGITLVVLGVLVYSLLSS